MKTYLFNLASDFVGFKIWNVQKLTNWKPPFNVTDVHHVLYVNMWQKIRHDSMTHNTMSNLVFK